MLENMKVILSSHILIDHLVCPVFPIWRTVYRCEGWHSQTSWLIAIKQVCKIYLVVQHSTYFTNVHSSSGYVALEVCFLAMLNFLYSNKVQIPCPSSSCATIKRKKPSLQIKYDPNYKINEHQSCRHELIVMDFVTLMKLNYQLYQLVTISRDYDSKQNLQRLKKGICFSHGRKAVDRNSGFV